MTPESDAPITESEALTDDVRVSVRACYSAVRSDPARSHWFFLYTIRIRNEGTQTVQLTDRHWIIVDGTGDTQEVRGEGVVGEQPVLDPGEQYEYTSGCPLSTPFGSMAGSYRMQRGDGTVLEVEIPLFELVQPRGIH